MFTSSPASNEYQHPIWQKSNEQRGRLIETLFSKGCQNAHKNFLDVGAGDLTIATRISELGYNVVAIEPRAKTSQVISEKLCLQDVDIDTFFVTNNNFKFDVVLALGVLYHLPRPAESLRKICGFSSNLVILDTVVLDHDGEAIVYLDEDSELYGNSITGLACRPSFAWIVRQMHLNEFPFFRDFSSSLVDIPSDGTSTGHLYNWTYHRTCGWRRDEMQLRKFAVFSKQRMEWANL